MPPGSIVCCSIGYDECIATVPLAVYMVRGFLVMLGFRVKVALVVNVTGNMNHGRLCITRNGS